MSFNRNKSIHDFRDSRENLADAVKLFESGRRAQYRVVASELRKLLCDGKSSLVPRLFPLARLHPLLGQLPKEQRKGLFLYIPAEGCCKPEGRSEITRIVNKDAHPIEIGKWLDQPLLSGSITVRDFIRSVADKESVHSDANYNHVLELGHGVSIGSQDLLEEMVVALGRYLVNFLEMAVQANPNTFGGR